MRIYYRLHYFNPIGTEVIDYISLKEYERLITLYPRLKYDYHLVAYSDLQIFNFYINNQVSNSLYPELKFNF